MTEKVEESGGGNPAHDFSAGDTFAGPAPFMRYEYEGFDEGGRYGVSSWRPGARSERIIGYDEPVYLVDGEGQVEYRVVSRHSPPGFPERVFYVRTFTTPDGTRLSGERSRALRVATAHKFRRMLRGWPVPYEVDPAATGDEG